MLKYSEGKLDMNLERCDLLIRAGRVFCAYIGIDCPGTLAVKDGTIVATGASLSGECESAFDFPDGVLLPGFVNLHAHPAPSNWKYGINPDPLMLPRGTAVLSQ